MIIIAHVEGSGTTGGPGFDSPDSRACQEKYSRGSYGRQTPQGRRSFRFRRSRFGRIIRGLGLSMDRLNTAYFIGED